MADWGPWVGDRVTPYDKLVVTTNTVAHQKGSWATLTGGTTEGADGLIIVPSLAGTSAAIVHRLMLDIGVGGADDILINNLVIPNAGYGGSSTAAATCQQAYFPVQVPPGASIRLRAQRSANNAVTPEFSVMKLRSGLPSFSAVDTYGANTGATAGVTLLQQSGVAYGWGSTYYEITPSCKRVKAFMLAVASGDSAWSSYTYQRYSIRIGVGAIGSEQEVMTIYEAGSTSSGTWAPSQWILGPYFTDIAEGSRIVAKVSKEHTTYQRDLVVVMYGMR